MYKHYLVATILKNMKKATFVWSCLLLVFVSNVLATSVPDLSADLTWLNASKDNFSKIDDKVVGSVDVNGKAYYICRFGVKNQGLVPGYLSPDTGNCTSSYEFEEIHLSTYEVMTNPAKLNLTWVEVQFRSSDGSKDPNPIPDGVVIAGKYTPDASSQPAVPYYLGRVKGQRYIGRADADVYCYFVHKVDSITCFKMTELLVATKVKEESRPNVITITGKTP